METIYPDGKIIAIVGNCAQIAFASGGVSIIDIKHLPAGSEVGDKVVVITETTVKKVEKKEIT